MKITDLQLFLIKNPNISLEDFLLQLQITQKELIGIVCDQELAKLYKDFGQVDTLTMASAAKAMDISYPHLVRLKQQGKTIRYSQKGSNAPVYFPLWAIAIYNYLRSNPIVPGEVTFSKLLQEIQ